ncbi:MAG: hypothetical protein ABW173_04495, partial [Sphingomonas sp.]
MPARSPRRAIHARSGTMAARHETTTDTASWWLVTIMVVTCVAACHGLGFTVSARRAMLPAAGLLILAGA